MTITVNASNGDSFEFPDGTSPETMKGAMAKHFGPPKNAPSMASGLLRSFSEGVPILGGLLNKADAATNAALAPALNPLFAEKDQLKGGFGERYRQSLATQEGTDEAFATEHPIASTAANIAGGIASTGGAAMTGTGAKLLGLTARSLPGMIGRGALSGAAIGGVDTAIRGGDATEGAIVGGAAGAAGPLIGAGVGKVLSPWMRAATAAKAPEIEAAAQIAAARAKDAGKGLSPAEIQTAVSRDQPVTLMDVDGGRATQRLARRAANVSPEAQELLDSTIFGRFREQNTRTAEWVQGLSEFGGDAHELDKALTQSAKRVNDIAYARARASPASKAMWDEGFEQLMQAPIVQQAAKSATSTGANRAAMEGFTPVQRPFEFHDTESLTPRYTQRVDDQGRKVLPSLEFWDGVKRNLDDKIKVLQRAGENSAAADAQRLRTALVAHLDDLVPEYAQARAGAAQFFGAKDALQAGRDAVTPGTPASRADNRVLRDNLAKMSPAERRLFREGTVDQMAQMLLGKPDSQNILLSINNTPKAKERLLTVLGPEKYNKLTTYLNVESFMDRFRTAMGNSTTARQLGDMAEGSVIPKLTFSPRRMMEDFISSAAKKLGMGIDERVATKIAEMLSSSDGKEYAKALRMISSNKRLVRIFAAPIATRGAASGVEAGSQDNRRRVPQ